MKTVKEVSTLTGISVRTLHFYDEIDLLKPTLVGENGYRLYDDKALETLQQILFFKELDFPLKAIKSILLDPNFDKSQTLNEQKNLLILKRNRLNGLIKLIESIQKGGHTMSFEEFSKEDIEELLEATLANMNDKQIESIKEEYGDIESYKENYIMNAGTPEVQENFKKVTEWYGGKDKAINVVKNMNPEETAEIMKSCQNRIDEIYKKLSDLQKEDIDSFTVKRLIGELDFVYKQLFQVEDAKVLSLEMANAFIHDEKMVKANDTIYGEGASAFIGRAIINFYTK